MKQTVFVYSGGVSYNGNKSGPMQSLIQGWVSELNEQGYRVVSFQMPDSNQMTKYGIFVCEKIETEGEV